MIFGVLTISDSKDRFFSDGAAGEPRTIGA